jgi:hypothetical protein
MGGRGRCFVVVDTVRGATSFPRNRKAVKGILRARSCTVFYCLEMIILTVGSTYLVASVAAAYL